MRIVRTPSELVLTINPFENRLLRQVLHTVAENYGISPGQIDARVRQAWYSTRGCATAGMSEEETRDWIAHLHQFRSARCQLLERIIAQLGTRPAADCKIPLKLEEASEFLGALNDHRLYLSASHDLGEPEMGLRETGEFAALPLARRIALLEIHLLAQLIEELLRHIDPEAAGWREA